MGAKPDEKLLRRERNETGNVRANVTTASGRLACGTGGPDGRDRATAAVASVAAEEMVAVVAMAVE